MQQRIRSSSFLFRWPVVLLLLAHLYFSVNAGAQDGGSLPKGKKNYKVIVTPVEAAIKVGETVLFSAHLEDKDGNVTGADFTWSIQGREIGTITSGGLFTAQSPGNTHVVASYENKSGKAKVTVESVEDDGNKEYRIAMEPDEVTLSVGDSLCFTACLVDRDGHQNDASFSWRVKNDDIGTIDDSGWFFALRAGNTFVYAATGNLEEKAHVRVSRDTHERNRWSQILVEPSEAAIPVGDQLQFTATLLDDENTPFDTTFVWSLSKDDLGTITEDGLFTALARGNTFVYASVGNLQGKARVHVSADSTDRNRWSQILVEPSEATINVGDEFQFTATLLDDENTPFDTTFVWSLSKDDLGTITEDGLFTALARGNTFVYASVGNLQGKARVHVSADSMDRNRWSRIVVEPDEPVIKVGAQLQFTATLLDSQDIPVDTTFVWNLSKDDLGTITEDGLFTALARGNTFVYASIGDLQGKAHVTIQDSTHWDNRKNGELTIIPSDTVVGLGSEVQYRAIFVYSTGEEADTTVEWKALGRHVGEITEDGIFTATDFGTGLIRAKFKRYLAMTRILVTGEADTASAEVDTVRMVFTADSTGQVADTTGQEGETIFTFEDLPWPMSMLNGGQIIFPPGSLDEDITIQVTMPDFAFFEDDTTVSYGDLILNGVSFHVYVGDSLVTPYYFDPPAHLALPYDSTMLQELNLIPDDLWMFFYTEQIGLDSTGIYNVVIDSVNSMIYAEVSHFSTLAIADRNGQESTSIDTPSDIDVPSQYRLHANYPNPFNPETTIRFEIAGHRRQRIKLSIFNILGQEIKTLIDAEHTPGIHAACWNATDEEGRPLKSGVYFYTLKGEQFSITRRMILLR